MVIATTAEAKLECEEVAVADRSTKEITKTTIRTAHSIRETGTMTKQTTPAQDLCVATAEVPVVHAVMIEGTETLPLWLHPTTGEKYNFYFKITCHT